MPLNTTSTLSGDILDVYSDEILYNALPVMKWLQFATIREDLMKHSGERVRFIKRSALRGLANLTEGVDMPTGSVSTTEIFIEVDEYGFAFPITRKALELAFIDEMDAAIVSLSDHYAEHGPEYLLQNVAMASPSGNGTFFGNQAVPTTQFANGKATRSALVAGDILTTDEIRDAAVELAINKTPKFQNDFYVCMIHPRNAALLRQDPGWIAADNGQIGGLQFTGAIGRWEDVVFIQTTTMPNGDAAAPTGAGFDEIVDNGFLDQGLYATGTRTGVNHLIGDNGVTALGVDPVSGDPLQTSVYQTLVFGEDYYGFASAVPVEVRDNGIEDHGRKISISWYAIYGADRIHPERGIIIESALSS